MSEIKAEQITIAHVRPRFSVLTAESSETIKQRIQDALAQENATCRGKVYDQFASLSLPADQLHYWSPRLRMTIEKTDEGTEVRGLYGPKPAVWTMFVFFYSVIGFATIIVAMLGLSYLTLNKPAGILWMLPVFVAMFSSLYLVAYFGKKTGYVQMVVLHQFIEKATGLSLNEEM
jgi:hypothetical protein